MWDKLLGLFKDKPVTNEIKSVTPTIEVKDSQTLPASKIDGKSVHIGYNYLKGLDGDYEDSSKHIRRFINLNKLLRGDYNGKIEATDAEPQSNLRGEDSE